MGVSQKFASELPPRSESQERIAHTVAIISLVFGAYWTYWRWTSTLNHQAMFFSLTLVCAETWGWLASIMFVFNSWKMPEREPPPAPKGRNVDVFITTYDEPLEVLRRTAIGARMIRYPHRTYVLDDGQRDEVKSLAAELGIGYIRREGHKNAKAGNLNHAISVTSGDFILQLDVDHVPLPHIIDRMLGYFNDPKVAFIQSPQDFYNTDSFTHVVNNEARQLWEENRIFYSLLQPGKDYWGASFFCGSCGMLRRAALAEIGGFSTHTIIEDMETSLVLHSSGWKSVYHPEALAFGLSPGSAAAFHVQRLRWAQGSMQILRKFNPLTLPGLTPGQRLCYLSATVYPVDGLQKGIFYLTPIIFLLTGWVPIRADSIDLLMRLVPYLFLSIAAFELMARGTGYILISERYAMAKFFTYTVALSGFVLKSLKFNVTPKGLGDVPFKTYAAQLFLLIISVVAIVWAPIAYLKGYVHYQVDRFDAAFWVSGAWVIWNIYFASYVVRLCLRMKQQRADHRFADQIPIRLRIDSTEDAPAREQVALTNDLNPGGLAFRSTLRVEPGTTLHIDLPLTTGVVKTTGEVVHVEEQKTSHGGVFVHGVRFEEMPVQDRDLIEMHCTHHSVPLFRKRFPPAAHIFDYASKFVRNDRSSRRQVIQLPVRLLIQSEDGSDPKEQMGLLEEMSSGGARLLLEEPMPPGTEMSFEVPGTDIAGNGEVVFSQILESPMSVRFNVGLQFSRPTSDTPTPSTLFDASPRLKLRWPGARKPAAAKLTDNQPPEIPSSV